MTDTIPLDEKAVQEAITDGPFGNQYGTPQKVVQLCGLSVLLWRATILDVLHGFSTARVLGIISGGTCRKVLKRFSTVRVLGIKYGGFC